MSRIILSLLLVIIIASCLRTDNPEQKFLAEIYYPELSDRIHQLDPNHSSEYWLNVIDFSDREDYDAGHIEHAVNIELGFFIDTNGYLVNQGKAITQRYDEKWPFVVYSFSNDTVAYYAAKTIQALGFSKVYFYVGGRKDWQNKNNDYLLTNYNSVKEWHKEYYPFEDTLMALVDVHPAEWYRGLSVLNGHIPGALNIPSDSLVSASRDVLSLIGGGAALNKLIPNKEAKIIVYASEGESQRVDDFLWAAKELNYTQLFLFQNGYNEWLGKGDTLSVVE